MRESLYGLAGWGTVLVAAGAALVLAGAGGGVLQPIAFSHQKHVKADVGDCLTCHPGAEDQVHAGILPASECVSCHSDETALSVEGGKLAGYAERGELVPWIQIYKLPPEDFIPFWRPFSSKIYFSHRRHVGQAKLECQSCHGAVQDLDRPLSQPLVALRMADCLSCHRKRGASTDCLACHR